MRPWAAAWRSCSAVCSRSSSEARSSGSAMHRQRNALEGDSWLAPRMESCRIPGQTEVLAMKLEQSFEVKAPIDQVWNVLIDLERVAPCLPGAAITDRDDE